MLIGIDASRYRHEAPTGVEVYSNEIIDGLLDIFEKTQEHQIRFYTPKRIPELPEHLQRVIPGRRLWTQRHLSCEMKKNPPDVLFVPSHVLPLKHPKKSILTIHDVAFRQFPTAYSPFQFAYLHWSTKFAVKHAWKIIVPSTAVKEDLERHYSCSLKKIVVIPHGFRPATSKLTAHQERDVLKRFHLHPDDPYVFFLGRLERKKNLERLTSAFIQFREQHPEWQMILGGGRGVGFRPLLKMLQRSEVMRHVIAPGYLTEEEKHVLYKYASFFAFPSLSEGFGFPILEAASYGLPILASDIPALKDFDDLVDEYVDPHDINSIANGLLTLGQKRSHQVKSALDRYSWPRCAQAVWKLLTS